MFGLPYDLWLIYNPEFALPRVKSDQFKQERSQDPRIQRSVVWASK